METDDERSFTVTTAGEEFTLLNGTEVGEAFFALVGFEVDKLMHGENTMYLTERQNFLLQCTSVDYANLGVAEGTKLSMTDGTFVFNFMVDRTYPDLLGYMILDCVFEGRGDV